MRVLPVLLLAASAAGFLHVPRRAAFARPLGSMVPGEDDYPSDSVLPDEAEPAVAFDVGGDAEAPSDVEDASEGASSAGGAGAASDADCPSDVERDDDDDDDDDAAAVDPAAAFDAEGALLDRVLALDRGATATDADRAAVDGLCADLEAMAEPFDPSALDGTWSLVYSSEPGLYRSSPFFWSFSRLLDGKTTPLAVPGAKTDGLADGVYAITDALGPLYTVGDATQTLANCGGAGSLLSEVELAIDPIPGVPPLGRSVMTSTASSTPTAAGLRLELEKTEVKDSTIASLPGLGFLEKIAFPTKAAFDALADALALTPAAATVELLATYTSDALRVTRTEGGALFVHERAF